MAEDEGQKEASAARPGQQLAWDQLWRWLLSDPPQPTEETRDESQQQEGER